MDCAAYPVGSGCLGPAANSNVTPGDRIHFYCMLSKSIELLSALLRFPTFVLCILCFMASTLMYYANTTGNLKAFAAFRQQCDGM